MQRVASDLWSRLCDCGSCDRCDEQAEFYSNKPCRGLRSPPPPILWIRIMDQCLTHDPAHSQLLIVTRHIWQIIILNNLLPWRWLTLMASDAPFSCPALWLEAFFPLCPLKVLGIRDVHYHFNLLFNPFNQPRGPRRERATATLLSCIWPRTDVCFTACVLYESLI